MKCSPFITKKWQLRFHVISLYLDELGYRYFFTGASYINQANILHNMIYFLRCGKVIYYVHVFCLLELWQIISGTIIKISIANALTGDKRVFFLTNYATIFREM